MEGNVNFMPHSLYSQVNNPGNHSTGRWWATEPVWVLLEKKKFSYIPLEINPQLDSLHSIPFHLFSIQ
jgi:hypothetical protein